MIYQFAFHNGVKPVPPECEAKQFHDKLTNHQPLSRQEKDRLAEILYGLFGQHRPIYKMGGWAFDFTDLLPCILVRSEFSSSWGEFYAPDKTSLRKALKTKQPMVVVADHTKWR